jgi:hypothetical protein
MPTDLEAVIRVRIMAGGDVDAGVQNWFNSFSQPTDRVSMI